MVREYLTTLKNAGSYTWGDIANLSGIPEATVRKVFSGETSDPRFETIAKIVIAMGGNMDDAIDNKKKKEIEISSTISLKESYEYRLADKEDYINSLKRDKKMLSICLLSLIGVVLVFLFTDIFLVSHGWFR